MIQILLRPSSWLALVGLACLVLFVRANTAVAPMPRPPLAPAEKLFARGIGAAGIVESLRENVHVAVPVSSLVGEVKVQVWQQVAKGDELLRLDDRELAARLETERAELRYRQAEFQRVRRLYERLEKIGAGPAVAREDLEKREDDMHVAAAQVEKARTAISATQQLLERLVVRSPISGTVLQVNIRAGEFATPGSATSPVIVGSIGELQIRADVDEQLAPRVRQGAKAIAYLKGEAGHPITLSFARIEPFIVPKKSLTGSSTERVDTRVLPVIFTFTPDETTKTYVGQQVDVFIEE